MPSYTTNNHTLPENNTQSSLKQKMFLFVSLACTTGLCKLMNSFSVQYKLCCFQIHSTAPTNNTMYLFIH